MENPPRARVKDLETQGRGLIYLLRGRRLKVLSGT